MAQAPIFDRQSGTEPLRDREDAFNVKEPCGRASGALNGIEPAPERGKHTRWSTFLESHWRILAASDFLSVEVWTPRGLMRYHVVLVISIADRVVHVAGITTRPDETWMLQIGRNLLDEADGALAGKKYRIIDRDAKYSQRFREFVAEGGTVVILLPPLSPNLNAFAERFVRSIKEECLGKRILVAQAPLRRAIGEYMTHFHDERNHQGLKNRFIRRTAAVAANDPVIIAGYGSEECLATITVLRHEVRGRTSGQLGI